VALKIGTAAADDLGCRVPSTQGPTPDVDVASMNAFSPSLPALAGTTPAVLGTLPTAPGGEGTLAGIAEHLGMSADSLQAALRDGQSIAALAEQQGVPRESVASFISTQIQRARQYSGQPPLDQPALERMVERALERGRRASAASEGDGTSREWVALATYASNARPAAQPELAGGTISLLA
jgi:hypothetical protein